MLDLNKWTLKAIRENDDLLWLEERRFEWAPLLVAPLNSIMDGSAIIVVTDNQRDWFCDYIIKSFNDSAKNRPLMPIFKLTSMFPTLEYVKNDGKKFQDYLDTLDVVFSQYIFWYIGKNTETILDYIGKKENNLLWIFDEDSSNSFSLKSFDKRLDIKLLSMYQLLDKTVFAALFGEVELSA